MNGTAQTNLHSLWDSSLISIRLRRDFQSNTALYYDHIYDLMREQSPVDNDNDIEQWINENIHFICSQIYLDEKNETMNSSVNFTLGEIYYQRSIPVIEQRLAQGGRRLGALLNQISKNRRKKPSELCDGTIAFITILGVEFLVVIAVGIFLWTRHKTKPYKISSFPLTENT
jgi:hypothetical protein